MSDARYSVVLSLSTEGNLGQSLKGATEHVGRADHGLKELHKTIGETVAGGLERVGGMVEGLADKVVDIAEGFAKWGVIAGVGLATYGVVHLNQELENTQTSMAAIFQAQGFASDFSGAWVKAGDQVAKMKQDVKTLPGDLGQLSNIMKMIATPAAAGGAAADDIRKLAGRTMLTAGILGVDQHIAAREMAGLLAGRAGSHNIFGSRLGLMGAEAQKFNALTPEARLARINQEMDKYAGAADRFGQGWIAQITTLKDNIKYNLLAPATAPLFESVKHSLTSINTWFDNNADKVGFFVDQVGKDLAYAWERVAGIVERLGPRVGALVDKLENVGILNSIGKIGGEGLALGLIAKTAPGMLGGLGGLAGGFGKLAGATTAAGSTGAALGVGGAAISLAALEGLALAAAAAGGELSALMDPLSQYHLEAIAAADHLKESSSTFVEHMNTTLLPKLEEWGVSVTDHLAGALDIINEPMAAFQGAIDQATGDVNIFGKSLGDWTGRILEEMTYFGPMGMKGVGMMSAATAHGYELADRHNSLRANLEGLLEDGMKPHASPVTNVKVEIVVKGNDDPSRTARLTLEEFKKYAKNPKASSHVPRYDVRNPGV